MSRPGPLAVALFNDNADIPHVGCLAVSDAHRRMLRRTGAVVRHAYFQRDWHWLAGGTLDEGIAAALSSPELLRVFDEVDAVVVNGEGTIHHRQGWYLVAILGAAQRLGVPTVLVNAVLQDVDGAREILSDLCDLTVRDAASAAYLQRLGVPHRLVPDSFFEAAFVDEPRHEFAGRLVITDCHPARTADFAPALSELRATWRGDVAEYPLEAPERIADWPHAVADLRVADAVVTGRHHGACLALAAGVPFVTLPSNTWKLEGLLDTIDGYPPAARDESRPLVDRVAAAIEAREWFATARHRYGSLPLPTFDRLRAAAASCPASRLPIREASAVDPDAVDVVASMAAAGEVLHAGCGRGALVRALSAIGIGARGVDVAATTGDSSDRCCVGTPHRLPFPERRFATVLASAGWLEHLEADELDGALAELSRVARTAVILEISGRPLRAHRADHRDRGADWWADRLEPHGLHRSADPLLAPIRADVSGALLVMTKGPASRPRQSEIRQPVASRSMNPA